jgi:ComF family protein
VLLSILSIQFLNNRTDFVQQLLPQDCLLCGIPNGLAMICNGCLRALPHHDQPVCPQCALPTLDGTICGRCLTKPPAFERAVAAFDYRYPLAEVLHAFKYGGRLAFGRFLADALVKRVQHERWPELIVPMPLHPTRLAKRGFNQAAVIAHCLSSATGLPLSVSALVKIRDTEPQVGLPWKQRRANVRNAFACQVDLKDTRIVIVDDVMTTGASLNEAAKTIKKRGAAEVAVWVVARTLTDTGNE